MSWLLPILAVGLGAVFYAFWARREGLLALESYRRGQLAELAATLGHLQEAVLVIDAENEVRLANDAARSIFEEAGALVGSCLDAAARDGRERLLAYVERVRLRQPTPRQRIAFTRRTAGSEAVWTEVAGTLMPPLGSRVGEGRWVLVVLHDITQQHKLETVRKDFVANVSHELRTPLSVIMGYVETLVDDAGATIPAETRAQFLLKIQRHTQRLNSLLDDLLSLSRLESEAPGFVREPVGDWGALIRGVVEDYRARSMSAAHVLRVHVDDSVAGVSLCGDALKLTQVLENLIDNALHYTPKGTAIQISTRRVGACEANEASEANGTADAGEHALETCVRDDGQGIPSEDLAHIFERFYRVDKGRSRAQGGTGLGLSIVKHIVQLHGGQVRVESTLGQGSAFYFTLPLAVAEAPA